MTSPVSLSLQYDILITHDDESGLYLAEVPDLPGCYSQGETEEQAVANAREAIALHVQTLREMGRDIPPPSAHALHKVAVTAI